MNKQILLYLTMAVLAFPASAGLFGPKGDSVEDKRAKVRQQRDEILAKLYTTHPEAKDMTIAAEMPLVGEKVK